MSVFPTDVLIEIFSYNKRNYSNFRRINRAASKAHFPWDGTHLLNKAGRSKLEPLVLAGTKMIC